MRARRVLALIALLSAAGCAVKDSRLAESARERLVGASELELETCLGVPDQHTSVGGSDLMTWYASSASSSSFSLPLVQGPSFSNGGWCHMTIRFDRGVASEVVYTGEKNAMLAPDAYCAPIVRTCMQMRGAARTKAGEP